MSSVPLIQDKGVPVEIRADGRGIDLSFGYSVRAGTEDIYYIVSFHGGIVGKMKSLDGKSTLFQQISTLDVFKPFFYGEEMVPVEESEDSTVPRHFPCYCTRYDEVYFRDKTGAVVAGSSVFVASPLVYEKQRVEIYTGVPWLVRWCSTRSRANILLRNLRTDEERHYIIKGTHIFDGLVLFQDEFYYFDVEEDPSSLVRLNSKPVNLVLKCYTHMKQCRSGKTVLSFQHRITSAVSCKNYAVVVLEERMIKVILPESEETQGRD